MIGEEDWALMSICSEEDWPIIKSEEDWGFIDYFESLSEFTGA